MGTHRQKMKLERNEKPKGHRKQKGKKQIVLKTLLAANSDVCFFFFFNYRFFCQLRKPDPCDARAVSSFSVVSNYFPRVIMLVHIAFKNREREEKNQVLF